MNAEVGDTVRFVVTVADKSITPIQGVIESIGEKYFKLSCGVNQYKLREVEIIKKKEEK